MQPGSIFLFAGAPISGRDLTIIYLKEENPIWKFNETYTESVEREKN